MSQNIKTYLLKIEVLKNCYIVSFCDVENNEIYFFTNQNKIKTFVAENINANFLISYNGSKYDFLLLDLIINNATFLEVFKLANKLINNDFSNLIKTTKKYFEVDMANYLPSPKITLNKYFAFLGLEVLPKLTTYTQLSQNNKNTIKKIIKTNLQNLRILFFKYIDLYKARLQVIQDYKLNNNYLKYTDTRLIDGVFWEGKKAPTPVTYKTYKYNAPDFIKKIYKQFFNSYYFIIEKFENFVYYVDRNLASDEGYFFDINLNNNIFTFSKGGLHQAQNNIKIYDSEIYSVDIVSNYANIIANTFINTPQELEIAKTIKYIIQLRNSTSDEIKRLYLKNILVRVFGAMELSYLKMFNPKQRQAIANTGQLIIFMLVLMVKNFANILQTNTDGIFIQVEQNNKTKFKKVIETFEKVTKLKTKITTLKTLVQKDVNNYVALTTANEIISKGAQVKNINNFIFLDGFRGDSKSLNNSLNIIDIACVNYLLFNIEPMETIKKYLNPFYVSLFMQVATLGSDYKYFWYQNKAIEDFNTLRFYFSKLPSDGPIFKVAKNNTKIKIPLSSERNKITNLIKIQNNSDFFNEFINCVDLKYYEYLILQRIALYEKTQTTHQIKKLAFSYPGQSLSCQFCGNSLENETTIRKIKNYEVCKNCYLKNN
ncbi:hypothetical protein [[Mycoplasma] gypis]|uniref:DNA-directed DNA polymerase n=1 Tax=[Mycoplasma] gypis TaxID=92404 RepID=A0ABZ2RRB6_9BACT|nr:hypothetical protein [[Mycoplasma] gypis]MBN0919446.1 hypothetical protein [[Mycoplasma] gypis]